LTRGNKVNEIDFQKKIYSQAIHPFFNEYLEVIKLPDFIWHYSSQYALSGIINKKEIWMSHALDMNDPDEILFGIEVIIDHLSRMLDRKSKVLELLNKEKDRMPQRSRLVDLTPIFILSFSEKADDLKQWIHYADNGYGVSLAFIRSKIINTVNTVYNNEIDLLLLPVNYYFKTDVPLG
jgi:hypothetical protein